MISTATVSSARAQLAIAAVGCAAFAMILMRFPPAGHAFYPRCPFHEVLGWQCPGCGMTRALADLLSGRIHEAARHNAMAAALSPFAAGYAWLQSYSALRWNRWRPVTLPKGSIPFAFAALFLFGIARNLSSLSWILQ